MEMKMMKETEKKLETQEELMNALLYKQEEQCGATK